MEKRVPRYYKVSLFGIGNFFSLYEKKHLQEWEFHIEKIREIPVYRLEQKEMKVISNATGNYECYKGYQLEAGFMKACNSFGKDDFFYDKEEGLIFYMSTFIYAERKGNAYFDLVTGLEIPRYAIEQVEKVTTVDDYLQLNFNMRAILFSMPLYQEKFMIVLKSYENRREALLRLEAKNNIHKRSLEEGKDFNLTQEGIDSCPMVDKRGILLGESQNALTFEQLIAYKKEIVDAGIQNKIDFSIQKIKKRMSDLHLENKK